MNIKYISYWAKRRKIQTEIATITKWDTWNNTNYQEKFNKGLTNSREVARENHDKNLAYECLIFEKDTDKLPKQHISIVPENESLIVDFIDNSGRKYLSYSFEEIENRQKLFLSEVWFFEFESNDTDNMKSRTHFVFDKEGNCSYRVYDMVNKRTIDYESKKPIDDKNSLYELYPEFDNYENVIKEERGLNTF